MLDFLRLKWIRRVPDFRRWFFPARLLKLPTDLVLFIRCFRCFPVRTALVFSNLCFNNIISGLSLDRQKIYLDHSFYIDLFVAHRCLYLIRVSIVALLQGVVNTGISHEVQSVNLKSRPNVQNKLPPPTQTPSQHNPRQIHRPRSPHPAPAQRRRNHLHLPPHAPSVRVRARL